jgi:putative ATP-binding cassette transporter
VPRDGTMMFLPQRSYLPLGTLAQAISYPRGSGDFSKDDMAAALERCGLGHLADRLGDEERWDKALSGGEQQRVAFARVILHRPPWVFMDEATAALDEEGQQSMLSLFAEELRGTAVVSIGHRAGVEAYHDRTLELVKGEEGARLVRKSRERRDARKAAAAAAKQVDRLSARLQRRLVVRDLARWVTRPRRSRDAQ